MISELLSKAEAAQFLGVTHQAVQALIANGRLPARRIGHQWTLQRRDVLAYAEERKERIEKGNRHAGR